MTAKYPSEASNQIRGSPSICGTIGLGIAILLNYLSALLKVRILGYLYMVSNQLNYASVAVVDIGSKGDVAIEAVSILEDGCVLSGAWTLEASEGEDIRNILFNKLILVLCKEASEILVRLGLDGFAEINSFLYDARESAESTERSFMSYVAEDPRKRSKLIEPSLTNWPDPFILAESAKVLNSMGKQAHPLNTPSDMRRTLAASRLLKLLIDAWLSDERERVSRKFLNTNPADARLLPPSWEFQFLQQLSR